MKWWEVWWEWKGGSEAEEGDLSPLAFSSAYLPWSFACLIEKSVVWFHEGDFVRLTANSPTQHTQRERGREKLMFWIPWKENDGSELYIPSATVTGILTSQTEKEKKKSTSSRSLSYNYLLLSSFFFFFFFK